MARSRVAVLKTHPSTVLQDYDKLLKLAGAEQALSKSSTTILKDNISWHFPYLSANTTPWILRFMYGSPVNKLSLAILGFAGIRTRSTIFGHSERASDRIKAKWFRKVEALGKKGN